MHPVARRFARLAALSASLACAALTPSAQEPRPAPTPTPEDSDEVVRINAELVQTDVMVFDKQGKFVDGLKAEQFELKVDGKPQAVTFFERVRAGAVDEDAQLAAARGGATRSAGDKTGAVLPLDRGRTVFFFVDDLHMAASNLARVQKTLLKFIEDELGQNDEAAVITASGQIGFLQQLTDEKAVLRAAVARLKPRNLLLRDLQSPPMTVAQALAISRNETQVADYFVDALLREMPGMSRAMAEQTVQSRSRALVTQSNAYNDNTLFTLENLVRASAPLPGRKLVFFISDGFLLDTRDGGTRIRMQSVTDAAARSGVVIYSLGAQGLTTGVDASNETAFDPGGRLVSTDIAELRDTQEPLHTLAADTGGRALVNTNSLEASVERALTETAVYYLLAWRPEGVESGSPKFRRIEASVKGRDDLRVIVRKGFYDAPPAETSAAKKTSKKQPSQQPTPTPTPPTPEKELFEALRSRHPRTSFPTSLVLGFVSTQTQGTMLTASLGIDRDLLARLAPGAKDGARVDVAGAVYNDKGDAVSAFKQELSVQPEATQNEGGRHTVLYSHPFRLAPGIYQVRVAALERQTNRAGSAAQWVEVPPIGQGQFSMSSLFVGERRANAKPDEAAGAGGEVAGVLVNVDGRFARDSAMRFLTYVYNAKTGAGAPPDVALQVQMFRDDQPVFTAPLIKVRTEGVQDITRIPYAAELPLSSFPPGRYLLQITALDRQAKASATRRVKFVIE